MYKFNLWKGVIKMITLSLFGLIVGCLITCTITTLKISRTLSWFREYEQIKTILKFKDFGAPVLEKEVKDET